MYKATNFFNLMHNYILGSFFVGMLLIAGLAIFSLSPIDFESYSAYKEALAAANLAADGKTQFAGGRVAGASVEGAAVQGIQVRQLLERRGVGYAYSVKEGSYQLSLDPVSLALVKGDQLDLLDIVNNSTQIRRLKVQVRNVEQSQNFGIYKYGLSTSTFSDIVEQKSLQAGVQEYTLKIIPGDATKLFLFKNRIGEFGPAAFLPAKNLELTLQEISI